MRIACILFLLATFLSGIAASAAEPPQRTVNIAMEDQFRNRHETGLMRGDVVALVYAERKGGEAAKELGRKLHVHFHPTAEKVSATEWSRQPVVGLPGWPAGIRMPDVRVIAVASMPEIPRALQPVARAQVRKDSPFVPVWLDFEGRLERQFGIVPGGPNLVLIDANAQLHSVLSGHLDEVKLRELVATIDLLRQQSRPDVRTAVLPASAVR